MWSYHLVEDIEPNGYMYKGVCDYYLHKPALIQLCFQRGCCWGKGRGGGWGHPRECRRDAVMALGMPLGLGRLQECCREPSSASPKHCPQECRWDLIFQQGWGCRCTLGVILQQEHCWGVGGPAAGLPQGTF